MKISIFGAGYVGLVLSFCWAKLGHEPMVCDTDAAKIAGLNRGELPIYEPGLEDIFLERVHFTRHSNDAISYADFIFIAVDTIEAVFQVAKEIAECMRTPKIIILKSTVLPGTATRVRDYIAKMQKTSLQFDVVSNPEFLREGSAILDFMSPARIIVGAHQEESIEKMQHLYEPILKQGTSFIRMSNISAELCKYAANAFLAMKIAFINEMSRLSESFEADILDIQKGLSLDPRIGPEFLQSGCGYGGACFSKDLQALEALAKAEHCQLPILEAIENSNKLQKKRLYEKLVHFFEGDLSQRKIALWGASFKPNTDDIRNASGCALIEELWHAGAEVQVYDPRAGSKLKAAYPPDAKLRVYDSAYAALENADALVLLTEWDEFKPVDYERVREALNFPLVLDGRNIWKATQWRAHGMNYFGMGQGDRVKMKRVFKEKK